jgi:hypothetical protein
MEEMLARLASTDELAAGALADALDAARRLAIGGQMRQAATRLTSGQLSPARQTQAAVLEGLRQLLDVLSSRRDYELARTVAALRQAAGELGALRQRGAQLADEVEAAAADNSADRQRRELLRLSRALEELDRQSEQLRRRLARLRAPRAAAALGRAAATAAAAAQSAAAASAADARQQARDAQRDLEEAEQEVAGAIVLAEEELAREQLARLEQLVAGIIARQSNLLAETQRLERLRRSGGLETAQQATLRSVAAEQNLLAEETEQLRPQAASADAFSLALEGAAGAMRRAGGLLLGGQTGAAPQTAQQQAIARLQHILAALRPDEPPGAPDSSPPDQQQPAASPPPGNLAGAMAELKLLTLLQESINRRTAELEQSRSAGTLTGDDEQELTTLSREQGKLADLVLGLIKATAERPEDERP